MSSRPFNELDKAWADHNLEWRDPADVMSNWKESADMDPKLLSSKVSGKWWETLKSCGITLFVTREYEHLVLAIACGSVGPQVSYLRIPHPSGLVIDRKRRSLYIASTRNPNQVYTFKPAFYADTSKSKPVFMPVSAHFYPGCLYMHDLALINGCLYANAVGRNTIVRLYGDGSFKNAWWPQCIEKKGRPVEKLNYIQLNSIAAGTSLKCSYFSASAENISKLRPGHKDFPVDKRGVIFSGSTRETVVRGLTRPHSLRWYKDKLWVDNSGYGEFGLADPKSGKFIALHRFPGWTRGLCFCKNIAFVGVSRVIPKFYKYAPGLDVKNNLCGIFAVDMEKGNILGSLIWPAGNQIFALDWIDSRVSSGLPFRCKKMPKEKINRIFYSYKTGG